MSKEKSLTELTLCTGNVITSKNTAHYRSGADYNRSSLYYIYN